MRKGNNYKIVGNTVEIELTQNQVTVIDLKDLPLVYQYKWCAHKQSAGNFYVVTNVKNPDDRQITLQLHKLIMQTPKGFHTDHIDHNGLNNCRDNLRIVTNSQNQMNSRSTLGSSSRFKGVSWNKRDLKWYAHIRINNKNKHLGYFVSEIDAAQAYDLAAKEAFGKYASLNLYIPGMPGGG